MMMMMAMVCLYFTPPPQQQRRRRRRRRRHRHHALNTTTIIFIVAAVIIMISIIIVMNVDGGKRHLDHDFTILMIKNGLHYYFYINHTQSPIVGCNLFDYAATYLFAPQLTPTSSRRKLRRK